MEAFLFFEMALMDLPQELRTIAVLALVAGISVFLTMNYCGTIVATDDLDVYTCFAVVTSFVRTVPGYLGLTTWRR
jgi:hypothetical protein